jgi:hypothetical protein
VNIAKKSKRCLGENEEDKWQPHRGEIIIWGSPGAVRQSAYSRASSSSAPAVGAATADLIRFAGGAWSAGGTPSTLSALRSRLACRSALRSALASTSSSVTSAVMTS